jgi:sigma-B regulation protein RsbQ
MDSVLVRRNVRVSGRADGQAMMFAHGFGCDSNMWRYLAPHYEDAYRVVLFDYVGHGAVDAADFDQARYGTLRGYAADVLDICRELDLIDVVFVGHSVSAMVGGLASLEEPDRFAKLVMIGPSPCYIDQEGYRGGFSREDIGGLLASLESNYLGWSSAMAPVIMGNPERPELARELANSFCRTDPEIARSFATVTFLSDNRADLRRISVPVLVLQCSNDAIAPTDVGEYVAAEIPSSRLVYLDATGHCPNLSAPEETIAAIDSFLRGG